MPMIRVYDTEEQAQDTAAKLASELPGIKAYTIAPSTGNTDRALKDAGVDAGDVGAYGAEIAKGRSVLVTHPLFGKGATAKAVLNASGALSVSPPPSTARESNARYTPFSDLLQWSPLTKRTQQAWWWGDQLKPAGVTSLGQPRLKPYNITSLGQPRLKKYDVASLGLPRLMSNPTPLSSMLGLKALKPYNVASLGQPRLKKHDVASLGIPRLLKSR